MEVITVKLGNAKEYDKALHEGLPEGGDLVLISKDAATSGGQAGVCITFTVEVDGKQYLAQAVTTLVALRGAIAALNGRYDADARLHQHLKK